MSRDQRIIKVKVAGLLELTTQSGDVSRACKVMGDSRDGVYRSAELHEVGDETALQEISSRILLRQLRFASLRSAGQARPTDPGPLAHAAIRAHQWLSFSASAREETGLGR